MALVSSLLDPILGTLLLVGSPTLGYITLRSAFSTAPSWVTWKRLAASGTIGIAWSVLLIVTVLVQGEISTPERWAESTALWAVLLTLFVVAARLSTRALVRAGILSATPLVQPNPTPSTPSRAPRKDYTVPTTPRPVMETYKPSQLRANLPPEKPVVNAPLPHEKELEAPVLENDVMDLLREGRPVKKKPKKEAIDFDTEENASPKQSPMSELSDFAGFEDTLAQLKKDLKDFNESVRTAKPKRGNA